MNQIGKYQILNKIGSGGFAVVYKGYDPFIKRPVAIKVCYSRDAETRERFHREAEIAGRLVHRNITPVYDFGLHEEMPYLVEEYLPGEDLAHMIRRREPERLEEAGGLRLDREAAGGRRPDDSGAGTAVRRALFGEFEQVPVLERRIRQALGASRGGG